MGKKIIELKKIGIPHVHRGKSKKGKLPSPPTVNASIPEFPVRGHGNKNAVDTDSIKKSIRHESIDSTDMASRKSLQHPSLKAFLDPPDVRLDVPFALTWKDDAYYVTQSLDHPRAL